MDLFTQLKQKSKEVLLMYIGVSKDRALHALSVVKKIFQHLNNKINS